MLVGIRCLQRIIFMNQQERVYFEALTKNRSDIAAVLNRRAVRGYKESVVEKYSDQAHFIYELLQNADDAGATNARFVLEKDRLIFAHNGGRHFKFKIERFIVPVLLMADFPKRKPEETLFIFPFDHPDRSASEAYDDISDKLQTLVFPLLFLTHLEQITFSFDNISGMYKKEVRETFCCGEGTRAEYLRLTKCIDGEK